MWRRVLRHPGVARLAGGAAVAEAGDWILMVALPLAVLAATGSGLVASTVFALQTLPALLTGPAAGVLIDRLDVWRLMPSVAVVQAAVLAPLLLATRPGGTWILYAVVALQSILGAIIEPCRVATVGALVPVSDLAATNQVLGVGSNLARLCGGPLGGLTLALGGLPAVLLLAALLYASAAVLLHRRRRPPRQRDVAGPLGCWQQLGSGLAVVSATPTLRRLMLVATLLAVAQGGFVIMFLLFVLRDLGGSETDVGVLRGVQAVGALTGALCLTSVVSRLQAHRVAALSFAAFGVLSLTTWNLPVVTTAMGVYIGLFALVGLPGLTASTAVLTIAQDSSPPGFRGRVAAILFAVLTGGQALGMLAGGLLGTGIGLTLGLQAQGCLYLLAALAALRLRPT